MRSAPCTCMPRWPISLPSSTTPSSSGRSRRLAGRSRSRCTSPAASARRSSTKASPSTTTCRTTAYAETCASVALIFWAQRMLNIDLDGAMPTSSSSALQWRPVRPLLDGTHYFYENPLESDGHHRRWRWHTCPCCTMNAPPRRLRRRLFLFDKRRHACRPSLWRRCHLGDGRGRRIALRETGRYPGTATSDRDRSRRAGGVASSPHPRLTKGVGAYQWRKRERGRSSRTGLPRPAST